MSSTIDRSRGNEQFGLLDNLFSEATKSLCVKHFSSEKTLDHAV
jgi:hypothetical protein